MRLCNLIHSLVLSVALREAFADCTFCNHFLSQTFLTVTASKGILGGRITPTSELASKVPGRLWHGLCSLFDSSTKRSASESQEDFTNIENIEFADTSDEDDVFENTYANIDHLKQPAKPEPVYATVKKRPKQSPKVEDTERNITVEQKKILPPQRRAKAAAASVAASAAVASTVNASSPTAATASAPTAATASAATASSSGGVEKPAPQETPQLPAGDMAAQDSEDGTEAKTGQSAVTVPLPVFLALTRNVTCSLQAIEASVHA